MDLMEQRQEREIDGVMYEAWPLKFEKGRPALVKLMATWAVIMGSVTRGAAQGAGAISGVFEALPLALSDADFTYYAKLFGDASRFKAPAASEGADDRWVPLLERTQNEHFQGRYSAYFQWIAFCMEVNFSNFFDGISGVLKGALTGSAGSLDGLLSKLQSKSTPTNGSSGEFAATPAPPQAPPR
jgi:hypothetical protein